MLNEWKFKGPSGNVVARLMGLEGLPYQQRAPTRCQVDVQDYVTTPCRHDFSIKEGDVCKDLFIAHETVKAEKVRRRHMSDRNFDGQRYMNEQSHASERKIHGRVKIGDPRVVVNLNKDVLVEFLQNPTPLLTKHLRGLESSDVRARCFRNTARKTMRVSLPELIDGRWSSSRQHECLCRASRSTRSIKQEMFEQSTSWSKSEYGMSTFPAKISILEPNRNTLMLNKHHTYYAGDSGYETKKTNIGKSVDHSRRRVYGHQVDVSVGKGRKSVEPQSNSKKKVRGLRTAAFGFIPEKSVGYIGDESSFDSSEDELKNMRQSKNSAGSSCGSSLSHYSDPPFHSKHSNSVSEHCETSGEWQTTTGSSKRISLGKIHGGPNKEEKTKILKSRIDGLGTGKYRSEANSDCMCLLGTDDMKVKYSRDSSRNMCLRGSSAALGVCKISVQAGRNPSQEDVSENEIVVFRNGKLSRNSHLHGSSNIKNRDYSKITVSNSYETDARSCGFYRASDYEHPNLVESPAPLEEEPNEEVKTCNLDMLISQEVFIQHTDGVFDPTTNQVLGSISSASSKEAEQPSPVSVHDFPNVDVSSLGSEYFGRVSADLQGLRAQIQMLKLDLAEDDDELEPSHNTGHSGTGIVSTSEEKELMFDQFADSSDLAEVLVECGFEDADPTAFLSAWGLLDVPPLKLSVFENLEKKRGQNAARPRAERRLLFDLIHSELVEILNQYTSPSLWGKSLTKKLLPVSKKSLESKLCKSQTGQKQKKSDENFQQKGVYGLDLWENTDEIGKELEETLVNDLVAEVFREGL